MNARRRRGRERGLTLVECAVTAASVGIVTLLVGGIGDAWQQRDRVACMNNLKMLGIALESYTSDYMGYLPCYPAWGSDVQPIPGKHTNLGLFADGPRQKRQVVRTGDREYYAGPSRYRCIAYGSRIKDAEKDRPPFTAGNLNVGPIGLGNLLYGGYLPDARGFFCPSVKNAPKMQGYGALTEFKELQRLAPEANRIDGHAIKRGDFSWAESFYTGQSDRGILSHYNYRGVPVAIDRETKPEHGPVTMPYVRPGLQAFPGCPMFKTRKQLGGRAVVCDSFDRPSKPLWELGFGQYAHEEGYNVLYGDNHVAWYADPDEKIMKMPWPAGEPKDASQGSDVAFIPAEPLDNTGIEIWHMLDAAAAYDVPRE